MKFKPQTFLDIGIVLAACAFALLSAGLKGQADGHSLYIGGGLAVIIGGIGITMAMYGGANLRSESDK